VTALYLRTSRSHGEPASGLLLDWFGRGGASTVSGDAREIVRDLGVPEPLASDFLSIAVAVYASDKVVLRMSQADQWTRSMRLHVPTAETSAWRGVSEALMEALRFLTNDRWDFRFRRDGEGPSGENELDLPNGEVALLSGGLDSLAGAIDLLEEGRSLVLVGHYDSNLLEPRQRFLFQRMRARYGVERVLYRPFYLRPLTARPTHARPLPDARETTTRSRSLLFIAAAGLAASALRLTRITMPENGFIGLNVPLEVSRLGACSTRTTHPHFLASLEAVLREVGYALEIRNPFALRTKGEVLTDCRNRPLLLELAPQTVSCAHPEVGRWSGEGYGNCGYCFPCLMRRAALHGLNADDPADYRVSAGDPAFVHSGSRADHLRALIDSIRRPSSRGDILRSGPIPRGQVADFRDVYERGRAEIRAWLDAAVPASR
jgi:7-cyano-7-deazaguanine synthase in queuosine biosynthesis